MRRPHGNRLRFGGVVLAAALLVVALVALPAIGKGGENGSGPRPAGKIDSFDPESGELVVALGQGGTISAKVVRRTQIRCGRHHSGSHQRRARRGEDDPANHDAGDDDPRGERGADSGRRGHCNADDLVPGAAVIKAEIVLTHGKALYKKIGLLPPAAATP